MGALKDLWNSERGLVAVALIAACTVLVVRSIITVDQWLEYTKFVFLTYAAVKTVTSTASILRPPGTAAAASPAADILSSIAKQMFGTPPADAPPGAAAEPPRPVPPVAPPQPSAS